MPTTHTRKRLCGTPWFRVFRIFQHLVDRFPQHPVKAQSRFVGVHLAVHLVSAVNEVFQGTQTFLSDCQAHPGFLHIPAEPQVAQQVIEIETADMGGKSVDLPKEVVKNFIDNLK